MIDYFYYTTAYGGKILGEEEFFRLKGRAQRYVSGLMRPSSRRSWCEAARFAACAAAEALHAQEQRQAGRAIQSETVGRHSVSYSQAQAAEGLYAAAARWLEPAGLLYQGIL